MKKKTSTLALVSLSASLLGAATAPDFVGADGSGSGDFSNPDHWNPAGLPGSKVEVTWKTPGTATCETPTSVGKMTVSAQDGAFVFDDGVFTSSQLWIGYGGVSAKVARNSLTIADGATWTVSGGETRYGYAANQPTTGSNGYNTLKILSGGTWITTGDMKLGYGYSSSNRIEICAGGVLDAQRTSGTHYLYVGLGDGTSAWNALNVEGACYMTNDYQSLCLGSGTSVSNVVAIRAGGLLKASGWVYIGNESSFNDMIVEPNATVVQDNSSQRYVSVGESATACSNSLFVAENADVQFKSLLYVGNAGSYNKAEFVNPNRLQRAVVGNADTAVGNVYYVHGDGTKTLTESDVGAVRFGAGSHNVIRLENLSLEMEDPPIFNLSQNGGVSNRLVFADGAQVASKKNLMQVRIGAGNEIAFDDSHWTQNEKAVRILDGGRLTLQNQASVTFQSGVYFSEWGNGPVGTNDVRVLSGSTLSLYGPRVYGSNSRFVVSNATISITTPSVNIPFTTSVTDAYKVATNNLFRFEGESPRLTGAGSLSFVEKEVPVLGQTVLELAVPTEPYAVAPVRATGDISFCASTRIRLELPDPLPEGKKWYPIAQTTDGKITVSDIEALGSELPQGAMLRLSSDKKLLEVRVPGSPTGLMLILR